MFVTVAVGRGPLGRGPAMASRARWHRDQILTEFSSKILPKIQHWPAAVSENDI
jgi:hypothetical protein